MAGKKRNGKSPGGAKMGDLSTPVLIQIRDEIRGMRTGLEGVRQEVHSLRSEMDDKFAGLRGEVAGVRTELKILTAREAITTDARLARIEKDVEDLKRDRT